MALDTDRIDDAVLALLYLGLHGQCRAWKGFDWDAMDRLHNKGMIENPVARRNRWCSPPRACTNRGSCSRRCSRSRRSPDGAASPAYPLTLALRASEGLSPPKRIARR